MAHSFTGCRAASHTGRACNKNSTRVTRRDPRERGLLLARDEPDARRAGEARARPERAAGREVAAQRGEHRLALRGRQLAQPLGRADPDWELAAEREKRGWERRGNLGAKTTKQILSGTNREILSEINLVQGFGQGPVKFHNALY